MGHLPHEQGFRKTGHKARNGTKRKKFGVHRQHRSKLPTEYERDRNRERRRVLDDLRAPEVDDYEPESILDLLTPSDYEEAA